MRTRYFVLALSAAGLITSCADDENIGGLQPVDESIPVEEDINTDLTRGVNVFISDHIGQDTLHLNTKQSVSLQYDESRGLTFRQARDEQGYICLIPDVTDGFDRAMEKVTVSAADQPDKQLTVILRNANLTRDMEPITMRCAEAIVRGIPVVTELDVSPLKILKDTLLAADGMLNVTTLNKKKGGTEISENSASKVASSWHLSIGLSGSLPVSGTVLGLAAKGSGEESTTEEHEREYYFKQRTAAMVSCTLDEGKAWYKHPDDGLLYYIDETLNDLLNNNRTNYAYPRTKEGIYRLLDNYGLVLADRVQLGGSVSALYSREQGVYQHSTKWDVTVGLSAKQMFGDLWDEHGNLDNSKFSQPNMQALLFWSQAQNITPNSKSAQLDINFGGESSSYSKVSKSKIETEMRGGNLDAAKGFEDWIPEDDPSKWVIISWADDKKVVQTKFYDLLDFAVDKTPASSSTRDSKCTYTQLILRYMDEYRAERGLYDDKDSDVPFVVADVIFLSSNDEQYGKYLAEANDSKHWHKGEYPKPFVMKSPDGKERIYYPLMFNDRDNEVSTANEKRGHALDIGTDSFVGLRHEYEQYIYYAMDRADRCNGIVDIRCCEDVPSGYIQRGGRTDEGLTGFGWWLTSHDERYVCVKLGEYGKYTYDPYTNLCNKITGLGVYCRNHEKVIASTPGTDIPRTLLDADINEFNAIWDKNLRGTKWNVTHNIVDAGNWVVENHQVAFAVTKQKFNRNIYNFTQSPTGETSMDSEASNPSIPLFWNQH